ncbi:hypothetical protein G6F54_013284 [Rhizopus delemar]|nr:hypothetical protein G6F54_013284 [Rhizopus delemar]
MYNLNVIYQHIKGVDNVEADQLSRTKKPLYESTIPKRFFRTIQSLWGPLDIDMFASRQNTQLPRYWSLRPDPQAMATDAFLQQWPMTGLYAYPPWNDTLVADTILVSDVAGNDETMSTDFSQAECKNDTSRMAVIRRIQQNEGLSQETMQFLGDAQRSGTQRTYDTGWNKWSF